MADAIPMTTPGEVNASGDYYRNLDLRPKSGAPPPQTKLSGDRLELFYHLLQGSAGTIRHWNNRDERGKVEYLNATPPPERQKGQDVEEYVRVFGGWRNEMLGLFFAEALSPQPNRLVSQAIFDYLFPGKVGKR